MAEYKEIIIEWSEKINLEKLKKMKSEKNNIKEDSYLEKITKNENVLYQLYGDSHIYGRDVLLYIGSTTNANKRLRDHLKSTIAYVHNISVSIGRIKRYDLGEKLNLEIPESILIANHKPSLNKEFIHDLSPLAKTKGEKIIVINNGVNTMLKTCCTNFWWVD